MTKKQTRAERKEQAIRTAAEHLASVPYPVEALSHILAAVECFPYLSARKDGEARRIERLARITEDTQELEQVLAYMLAAVEYEREIAAEDQRKAGRAGHHIEVESCLGCIDRTEINAMLNSMDETKGSKEND